MFSVSRGDSGCPGAPQTSNWRPGVLLILPQLVCRPTRGHADLAPTSVPPMRVASKSPSNQRTHTRDVRPTSRQRCLHTREKAADKSKPARPVRVPPPLFRAGGFHTREKAQSHPKQRPHTREARPTSRQRCPHTGEKAADKSKPAPTRPSPPPVAPRRGFPHGGEGPIPTQAAPPHAGSAPNQPPEAPPHGGEGRRQAQTSFDLSESPPRCPTPGVPTRGRRPNPPPTSVPTREQASIVGDYLEMWTWLFSQVEIIWRCRIGCFPSWRLFGDLELVQNPATWILRFFGD